jgi:hypothetical protein
MPGRMRITRRQWIRCAVFRVGIQPTFSCRLFHTGGSANQLLLLLTQLVQSLHMCRTESGHGKTNRQSARLGQCARTSA